jgi:hypothetical protein
MLQYVTCVGDHSMADTPAIWLSVAVSRLVAHAKSKTTRTTTEISGTFEVRDMFNLDVKDVNVSVAN